MFQPSSPLPVLSSQSATRRRGSTLLLVLAALLLTMILGITYMQIVRLDRKGAIETAKQNDVDIVQSSVVNTIGTLLRDDLGIDSAGTYFTGGKTLYDYPGATKKWLSTSAPVVDPSDSVYKWLQISYLNPTLAYQTSAGSTDTVQTLAPADAATVGSAKYAVTDADGDGITDSKPEIAPIPSIRGIDYFVSIKIVDNSAMINANTASALVGTSQTATPAAYGATYADAPRMSNPGELDLGNFAYYHATTPFYPNGPGNSEVVNSLQYLYGGTPTIPVAYATRLAFWNGGPRRYDNYTGGLKKHLIDSELELRMRGGLSSFTASPTIEDTSGAAATYTGMRLLLRQYNGNEISNSTWGNSLTSPLAAGRHTEASYKDAIYNMTGTQGGTTATDFANFFAWDPRHAMTTLSGANIHAYRLAGIDAVGPLLKKDLNNLVFADRASNVASSPATKLAGEFNKVFNLVGTTLGGSVYALPGALKAPSNVATLAPQTIPQFVDQFAANTLCYSSADNKLYKVNAISATDRYGFQPLPVITEVYRQQAFKCISWTSSISNSWSAAGTSVPGGGIEIRNPYAFPISLQNVILEVEQTTTGTWVNWGQLSTLAAQPTLAANSSIVLCINSSGLTGGPEAGINSDTIGSLVPAGTAKINIAQTWPIITLTGLDFRLRLRASDATGAVMATSYFQAVGPTGQPTSKTFANFDAPGYVGNPATDGLIRYQRITFLGNNNGLNAMTVIGPTTTTDSAGMKSEFPRVTTDNPKKFNAFTTPYAQFGLVPKVAVAIGSGSFATVVPPDRLAATKNQFCFKPDPSGAILHAGDLALISTFFGIGTVAGVDYRWPETFKASLFLGASYDNTTLNSTPTERWMLDFSAPQFVGTGDLAVPYAVFLMDRFTTLSPAVDGLDNDGNGTADSGVDNGNGVANGAGGTDTKEWFVPGTINLNTVPYDTLRYILPIPPTGAMTAAQAQTRRDEIAKAIINFRENNTGARPALVDATTSVPYRTTKGIAYLGEMYNLNIATPATNNPGADGVDNPEADFLGQPTNNSLAGDGIIDDREEKSMLMRWIMQTCNVRSDIFTAYILIRGYDQATNGLVAQRRVAVVFDRSRVYASTDQPRVLGTVQY